MILTSGLNACKSRRGVATQKTDTLNSTHWSLRKSLIPKNDNMSKLGYPSQKSQKLRYFERKEVILAFTRDPHAMAATSKWCETETNTSVHCGRSTHTTWLDRVWFRSAITRLHSVVYILLLLLLLLLFCLFAYLFVFIGSDIHKRHNQLSLLRTGSC